MRILFTGFGPSPGRCSRCGHLTLHGSWNECYGRAGGGGRVDDTDTIANRFPRRRGGFSWRLARSAMVLVSQWSRVRFLKRYSSRAGGIGAKVGQLWYATSTRSGTANRTANHLNFPKVRVQFWSGKEGRFAFRIPASVTTLFPCSCISQPAARSSQCHTKNESATECRSFFRPRHARSRERRSRVSPRGSDGEMNLLVGGVARAIDIIRCWRTRDVSAGTSPRPRRQAL